MASGISCCAVQFLSSGARMISPFSHAQFLAIQTSTLSSASSIVTLKLKITPPSRASSEGVPNELLEDSKFVPLTADDPRFGPPALLLLGFEEGEAVQIQQLLKDLDGEFMEVIFCTEDMITQSLWKAVNRSRQNLESTKIAKSLPRICFLSGLTGEEMMMFIDAFPETGLEPAVFAALVPNSADVALQELIDEIMGDHQMLVRFVPIPGFIFIEYFRLNAPFFLSTEREAMREEIMCRERDRRLKF